MRFVSDDRVASRSGSFAHHRLVAVEEEGRRELRGVHLRHNLGRVRLVLRPSKNLIRDRTPLGLGS
eukprot:5009532-Pyramimonas_sp.AAC.1